MPACYRMRLFAALSLVVVAIQPASGKNLEDRDWLELHTPHFQIYSPMGERDSMELARHLELLRKAVSIITNISQSEASVPTEIYVVESQRDLQKLGLSANVAGVFIPSMRKNLILIREGRGNTEIGFIMHEYIHFLVRQNGALTYPRWFQEGIAEYFRAARLRANRFEIGGLPPNTANVLHYVPWISISRIIAPEEYSEWTGERKAMSYAEAWGLVHYLINRPREASSLGQELGTYIELLESGEEAIAAFETAFGMTTEALDMQVQRHLTVGRLPGFELRADRLLTDFDVQVSHVPQSEIALRLAEAALTLRSFDEAERLYAIAARSRATRPRAETGLGDLLKFRDKYEEAQPHFDRAVELAPDDPLVRLDTAEYWHDRAKDSKNPDDRPQFLQRAREHYVKAWQLDDSIPETYAYFGQTFADEGEQYGKAIEMLEHAEKLLPSNMGIRLFLAEAYAGAGQLSDAEKLARSVLAWSHEEGDFAKRSRAILARTEGGTE